MMMINRNILVTRKSKQLKCLQGTEYCKPNLDHYFSNKAAEIKKVVTKSDVYMDDY